MTPNKPLPGTEQQNPSTLNIDTMDTAGLMALINSEDMSVPLAVQKALPQITKAVDTAYEKLAKGGRMIYVGAGTSGRLGVLDASECPPTYGTPHEMVQGFIAGGDTALRLAAEGCEDDADAGAALMDENNIGANDIVVGITASGGAAYVIAAAKRAKQLGAATVAVVNNSATPLSEVCDIAIEAVVGAEVVTGSTRMKSGTAQKLVLNMLSTGVMVKLGKVYDNLMVDMRATNKKLYARAVRIVCTTTGESHETAEKALKEADMEVKTAIMTLKTGKTPQQVRQILGEHGGRLKEAIQAVQ